VLRTQIATLLKNVCMHLYRNSMDHGLEAAAERVQNGKSPTGHIHLTVSMQGDQLAIRLHDDGRGLAVGHIRRKAMERGLMAVDSGQSAEEVAQLIFQAGFSTADAVTEVSGRGVGMDAVKGFVEAAGGSIALVLSESDAGSEFVAFETLVLLPGKFAVVPALRLLQQTA
jgi:two-component system, chemotaxis family, sensor kinase CheA